MKDKVINLLLEKGRGKNRKKQQQSFLAKKANADAKARTKRGGTSTSILNQTDVELRKQGYSNLDVIDNPKHRATAVATRSAWQKDPNCVGEMCKAVIGAHATETEKDLSQSAANKQSKQLHKGTEQTGGATAEKLMRDRPDQPRGPKGVRVNPEEEDVVEAQTPQPPLNPLNPLNSIDSEEGIQAYRKKQRERLQRTMLGNAPPIFPDNMDAEMNEVTREKMFPRHEDIPQLTYGLSKAQIAIWKRAMGSPSSARKEWRTPTQSRRLAKRLADSILYERDERTRRGDDSSILVKRPTVGGQPVAHLRTGKSRSGGLTGSDAYRPSSAHATLVRAQPKRFIEKMSSLLAAWRHSKTGEGRQVTKNLAITPKRGEQARKRFHKGLEKK